MQLPNKLYSYQQSNLALIPIVLDEIKRGHTNVAELFRVMNQRLDDATDFLSVMDCLYTLNAIEITDDGEVILCL